jgi:uncharacterized protein (UPF0335 family)
LRGYWLLRLDARWRTPHCGFIASGASGRSPRFAPIISGGRIKKVVDDGRYSQIAKTGVAAQELTQFVERVERLEEEKKAISEDIRDVYAEMKRWGFDVRAVRQIVRIRKQDHSERKEMEAILELYMSALNMK